MRLCSTIQSKDEEKGKTFVSAMGAASTRSLSELLIEEIIHMGLIDVAEPPWQNMRSCMMLIVTSQV